MYQINRSLLSSRYELFNRNNIRICECVNMCFVPMSILGEEHFMEGELSVQVSLNHIHPALQSSLRVQRLTQKQTYPSETSVNTMQESKHVSQSLDKKQTISWSEINISSNCYSTSCIFLPRRGCHFVSSSQWPHTAGASTLLSARQGCLSDTALWPKERQQRHRMSPEQSDTNDKSDVILYLSWQHESNVNSLSHSILTFWFSETGEVSQWCMSVSPYM